MLSIVLSSSSSDSDQLLVTETSVSSESEPGKTGATSPSSTTEVSLYEDNSRSLISVLVSAVKIAAASSAVNCFLLAIYISSILLFTTINYCRVTKKRFKQNTNICNSILQCYTGKTCLLQTFIFGLFQCNCFFI